MDTMVIHPDNRGDRVLHRQIPAVYCKRVGLVIHPNGELGGPEIIRCNSLQDSCQQKNNGTLGKKRHPRH